MMNEIQILGRTIKIKVITQKELEKVRAPSEPEEYVQGAYIPTDETIYISRALTEEMRKRTLLHEIYHVMLDITGASILLEDKTEEVACTVTENFLELFRHKTFIDFLNKKGP